MFPGDLLKYTFKVLTPVQFQVLTCQKTHHDHFVRRMMCTPESVSTGASLISPTFKAKVASSKGFCICPLPNIPRSPPFLAELQSLYLPTSSSKVASLLTICLL